MCQTLNTPLIAHTPNKKEIWHNLQDHLESVATLTEIFSGKFGAGKLGYFAGLWHDIGKINSEFQQYLYNCYLAEQHQTPAPKKGIDHKTFGSIFSEQQGLELLAFPIQGHHGGLPSRIKLQEKLQEKRKNPNTKDVFETAQKMLKQLSPEKPLDLHYFKNFTALESEFLLRMLFSCLVDADFLDTENHFDETRTKHRTFETNLNKLFQLLEASQANISGKKEDTVNTLRHQIYTSCLQQAELPPGIFRLTVPTGGGKTRSSLAFALKHAIKHQLDRVIMVIPYTSIIEQTADVYRQILGEDMVLEHHSGLSFSEDENNPSEREIKARLASENWDAPLIVTTTVQFFESLFAHKTSKCRKLHNIAKSVVILDEVQTLPSKFLDPILDILAQLVKHYHITIVLCTATQPALDNSPYLHGLPEIIEIVPEPEKLFLQLKRVNWEFQLDSPMSWQEVADKLREEKQALCIVNTKKDALALLQCLPEEHVLHLSTLLCGAHRRNILKEVKNRLQNAQPCLLVSTQVVEAGVDLDFPTVFRAVGPLDRIVQAAGRCNREGKMEKLGKVFIFEPSDGKIPPGEYRTGTDNARSLLCQNIWDLNMPDVFERYFNNLYQTVDTDAKKIQISRQNFDYPEVSAKFRIISDDTVSVVVRYDEKRVHTLLEKLQYSRNHPKTIVRKLQPYIVSIRMHELKKHQQEHMVREIFPGLWEWLGKYDNLYGLKAEMMEPEDLVI